MAYEIDEQRPACDEDCCVVGTDLALEIAARDPADVTIRPMFEVVEPNESCGCPGCSYVFKSSDMDDPLATVR